MEGKLNIRQITLDDADAIHEIRMAISEDDGEVNLKKHIELQIMEDAGYSNLVAQIDQKIVGYMISTVLYAGFGIKKSAWIMAIGVHPDHMGQGIGLKLAEKVCDIYKERGVKDVYSSVSWDAIDVLSFFKKLGFKRSDFINLKKTL